MPERILRWLPLCTVAFSNLVAAFHSCLASHPLLICLGHRLLIRLCIFRRHGGVTLVSEAIHGFVVFVFWCGSGPVLCCFAVFSAGETQIWPRDLRVVAVAMFLSVTFLPRFSHCQDRALERDRPQQREKKRFGGSKSRLAKGGCGASWHER